MGKQTINLGASPGDNSGNKLRAGGTIINENFDELYLESIWAFFVDGVYLALGSGLSISSTTRTKFECDGASGLTNKTQAATIGDNLWNTTHDAVNPIKSGDSYDVRITFKCETSTGGTGHYVNLDLDIGSGGIGTGPVIWEESKPLLKGPNVTTAFSFSIPIFALPPFFSADYSSGEGGVFYITSDVNITIWDIRIYIIRTHTAI